MKNYKNIISMLLAILLLISSITIMPLSASAAGNGPVIEEGNYRAVYYEDGTAMLIEAKVSEEHITVPSKIGDYTITEISGAYKNNKKIKSVVIPDTVTGILGRAFENCKKLESVTIPDSVTKISGSAFAECASLKSITIPDSVTAIDSNAFNSCVSLKKITIPDSVSYIGEKAFYFCSSLSKINISQNPELIIEGDAFNDTKWYDAQPDGVVYLDRFALNYKGEMPKNLKVDIKEGTTDICSKAFTSEELDTDTKRLVKVTFPNTLRYIGDNAFYRCINLKSVEFPDSLTHIGSNAFANCKSIKSITIPAGVKDLRHGFSRSGLESVTLQCNPEMWSYAFYECENLKEINLSDNLEIIDLAAFYGSKVLTDVTIPDSVKVIEWAAFKDCEKLSDIKHSGNIYIINNEAFQNTAWENAQPEGFVYFGDVLIGCKGQDASAINELIIKDGVKGIADGVFKSFKNLEKVDFPEGLKAIGAYSFNGTSVEKIVIPESVEFIGYGAFANCTKLSSLDIKGGDVIEYEAFVSCNNLKSVTVSDKVQEIGDDAFGKYYTIDGKALVDGFVIKGYRDSAAESYAKENGIDFEPLTTDNEGARSNLGDVNNDGKVNVKDATLIQKYSAKIEKLSDTEFIRADVNKDAKVNIKDATAIQKYVAKIETGLPIGKPVE